MKTTKPTFTFNGWQMAYKGIERRTRKIIVTSYEIQNADRVRITYPGGEMTLERGHSSFFGAMQAARECNNLEPLFTLDQFAASYAA